MKKYYAICGLAVLSVASCTHRPQDRAVAKNVVVASPFAQNQIENAVDAGDGDIVARALRERLVADPTNLDARLQLAAHYRQQGVQELAIEHYTLAAERAPDNQRVILLRAQALHEMGLTKKAADSISLFLSRHQPANSDLPAWLGILRDDLGEYAAAESAHRAAVSLNPSSAKMHNNLGYNLLLRSKRDEAIAEFRRALALDPLMNVARNNLGLALTRDGTLPDRNEALQQWIAAANPAVAHNNMAAVLMEQGHYAEARKELEAALGFQRNYTPALKNLDLLAKMEGKQNAVLPMGPKANSRKGVLGGWRGIAKRTWHVIAGIEERRPAPGVTLAAND
ncbi:MAG: tetratricopeptide repeat protein [Candidatus Solibacter usitatus]|nr:tetratricopeptide repeat protein [Candidatus Solibacter usitatus]